MIPVTIVQMLQFDSNRPFHFESSTRIGCRTHFYQARHNHKYCCSHHHTPTGIPVPIVHCNIGTRTFAFVKQITWGNCRPLWYWQHWTIFVHYLSNVSSHMHRYRLTLYYGSNTLGYFHIGCVLLTYALHGKRLYRYVPVPVYLGCASCQTDNFPTVLFFPLSSKTVDHIVTTKQYYHYGSTRSSNYCMCPQYR